MTTPLPDRPQLDARAEAQIVSLMERLLPGRPVVLEIVAGATSLLPDAPRPGRMVGLGPDEAALARNAALDDRIVHDLNARPELPFDDAFDAVLANLAVEYLDHPVEVFRAVGRALKPGGLFLVVFSNRFDVHRVAPGWAASSERRRVLLVSSYFEGSAAFDLPRAVVAREPPRPLDHPHMGRGTGRDPVYAVYADRKGGSGEHTAPFPDAVVNARKREVGRTLQCPYCGDALHKLLVPDTPFSEWPSEFQYVCLNDGCAYFVAGWETMAAQHVPGSYRFMYEPGVGGCYSIPVLSRNDLWDRVLDE